MQALPNQGATVALLGLVTALAFIPVAPPVTAQETRQVETIEELSPTERELLHRLVREAILERPEVIMEALDRLRARTGDRPAPPSAMTAPVPPQEHHHALFDQHEDLRLGHADAPIRIVKFVDYACGFCRRAGIALETILEANPDVHVIVKDLPVLGSSSRAAARTMLAAMRQAPAKAKILHHMLLRADRLDPATLERLMADAGLDETALRRDREGADVTRRLQATAELADAIGISGTPWFVTPHETLRGFPGEDALLALIARERERLHTTAGTSP